MANEAVIITLLGDAGNPMEYIVDDTVALPKGTIMKLGSSPQTAAPATVADELIVGVNNTEKVADDGITRVSILTKGIFDMKTKAGGSMVLGKPVRIDGANQVDPAVTDTVATTEAVVGQALETVGAAAWGAVFVNK